MSIAQSVFFSWIGTCVFMILLVLKLDDINSHYIWFIVFIPRFVVCLIDIIHVFIRIVEHLRNGVSHGISMPRKLWYIGASLLEAAFEILLCIRLDGILPIKLYFVFIPLWILLIGQMANFFHFQIAVVKS